METIKSLLDVQALTLQAVKTPNGTGMKKKIKREAEEENRKDENRKFSHQLLTLKLCCKDTLTHLK